MDPRERLVQLVSESGISQTELARRVGENIQWVNNRVRGEAEMKAADIPRLAAALGVPPSAFFRESSLAEVLLVAITGALAEMPPKYRRQLWDLASPEESRSRGQQPRAAAGDRDATGTELADRLTRRFAELFGALPEDEKALVKELLAPDKPRED